MGNVAGSLHYDTKMDTKGIDSGLDKVDKKASSLGGTLQVALGNLLANLTTMAVQGLKEIAKAGISYNAQIEKYQTALTTLTGSASKANEIIEQIKKDAASTPFDVNGLVQANQLLISAGISSEQARDDILALGNAISATGGGNEELSRMAVNLQQIKNVGKASSLDIKQFAYAGIDVYGLLADATGKSREEVAKMEVTYDDLTKALKHAAGEGGKYAGAMEAQSKTFNGQISNLKDNLNSFIGETMEPLFGLLKDDILPIVNALIQGEKDATELLSNLGNKIIEFIANVLTSLLDALPQIVDIGIKVIVSLIQGISKQLPTLIPKIVETVILIVNTLLDNLDLIIDAAIELILALALGLVDAIPLLLEKIPEIIVKIVEALTNPNMLAKLIQAALKLIVALGNGLIKALPQLLLQVPRLISGLFNNFLKVIKETNWLKLGKDILKGILDGLLSFGNTIKQAAKKVYNEIKNKIKDFFKIGSPSKAMRDEIGQWIPKGIAVGIETNTDSVDDAIDDLNDDIMDKMTQAVNVEAGKMAYSGTNGTITQMMSAFGTTTVVNENKLLLDGDEIYANQQTVTAKKNLQTQFGGDYSVSS